MTIGVCRNGHKRTADNTRMSASGKPRCLNCQAANNRRSRAKKALIKIEYAQLDGWEDEFGPAPERAFNETWYDEVIVHRALHGYQTGRKPFPLEAQAIAERMEYHHTGEEIAYWCGVNTSSVSDWIQRWGKSNERAS